MSNPRIRSRADSIDEGPFNSADDRSSARVAARSQIAPRTRLRGFRRFFARAEDLRVRWRHHIAPPVALAERLVTAIAAAVLAWRHLFAIGAHYDEALAEVEIAIVVTFVIARAVAILVAPHPWTTARRDPIGHVLALADGAALGARFGLYGAPGAAIALPWLVAATEAYLILGSAYAIWSAGLRRFRLRPSLILALSFAVIIAVGTGVLLQPACTPARRPITLVDALFTATSAACVTGLTVRDTGTDFTREGQVAILVLIQVGGLGIMTLAAFFASTLGRGLSIRDQMVMREMLQTERIGGLPKVLVFILVSTLVIEAAGAAALYAEVPAAAAHGSDRLFTAVFQAVSAFCNAGFSLWSDNLGQFARSYVVLGTVAALIVLGGLGYVVLFDLFRAPLAFAGRRWAVRRRTSLQTRLVLFTSAFLLAGGAGLLALYEWRAPSMAGWDPATKVVNAAFLSVSCRTAGFNVAPIGVATTGALLVMMGLMFIGGSPGSTAGGIKTTTFSVLTFRVVGLLRHREEIEVLGRTIPRRLIANAIGIAFTQIGLVGTTTLVLNYTDPHIPLGSALFEVVSAFGTVGLSTGITPSLSTGGKLAICFGMFAGRIGPLTLILAMGERAPASTRYSYPTGRVMIG